MNTLTHYLTILTAQMAKRTELIGVIIVIAIILMMIVPLPLFIIDFAISLNIFVAALLAIQSLFLIHPLSLSTFPAILLLTTMFRLALTIATTRLILLNHDAGHIVETFGNFVVGGNLVVGLVVFSILTLVNFLVITKGAERVAEVSARFTLDAMPGKQMAIDSDLRSGLIDVSSAHALRNQLTKESQLFGAMDGAMKFVKGDAISGIIIVFINLLGGFTIGILQKNMRAAEAIHVYSILSIGDGLVAQIPALLISLSAGMIITRVSPENIASKANIGSEIAWQMTSYPQTWLYASLVTLFFSIIPGMPTGLFIMLGSICLLIYFTLQKQKRTLDTPQRGHSAHQQAPGTTEEVDQENTRSFTPLRPYLLQFHTTHEAAADTNTLIKQLCSVRNAFVTEYGLMLPSFEFDFVATLPMDEFQFCVHEVPHIRATYASNLRAVRAGAITEEGTTPGTQERDEHRLWWVAASDPRLASADIVSFTPSDLIIARVRRAILATGWQFIGLKECRTLLDWLVKEQSELVLELERHLSISTVTLVIQNLAAEHVGLRSLRVIVETLVKYGRSEKDPTLLTEQVRYALRWQICHQYCQDKTLFCWLFSQASEALLLEALNATEYNNLSTLPASVEQVLMARLDNLFPLEEETTSVLLVNPKLRPAVAALLKESFNYIPVLSFSELIPTIDVHVRGRVDIQPSAEQPQEVN